MVYGWFLAIVDWANDWVGDRSGLWVLVWNMLCVIWVEWLLLGSFDLGEEM